LATLVMLSPMFATLFQAEALAEPRAPLPSRGCRHDPPTAIGQTEELSMVFDDLNRTYTVHLPPSYNPKTPHSLVLSFHGYGGNSEEQENNTSLMSVHADDNGYIVVYPEAYPFENGSGGLVYTWNDLACNGSPGPAGPICAPHAFKYPQDPCATGDCNWCGCQDDVGFVEAMLDELEDNYCIDTRRVYATGFSAGGMFVQRLGCDLPDRFAAIAPVHGFLHIGFNCAPDVPISTMNVWGSKDRIVPADGSLSSDGFWYTPVNDVMDAWGSAQGCEAGAMPYPTSSDGTRNWACTQRANCVTGAEVVSCSWRAPHWYPKTPQSDFGNTAIWEFFSKHSR
jgi:polyhydroxybutyrate depolymerase